MSGTKRKHTITWAPHHNALVLEMWAENITAMRSAQKNNHIYQRMAEKLVEAGLQEVEWKHVRTKIDNLTRKYKKEVKDQGTTGGTPSTWRYFKQVHRILGNFNSMDIPKFAHESADSNQFLEYDNAPSPPAFVIESSESQYRSGNLETNEAGDAEFLSDEASSSTSSQMEMTPFEIAMLEATNRRTDELVTIGRNLNALMERRANTLDRIEKILERITY